MVSVRAMAELHRIASQNGLEAEGEGFLPRERRRQSLVLDVGRVLLNLPWRSRTLSARESGETRSFQPASLSREPDARLKSFGDETLLSAFCVLCVKETMASMQRARYMMC